MRSSSSRHEWIATAPIDFYHTKGDCSDSRYIMISGGSGFACYAAVRGDTAFYTKSVDMSARRRIRSWPSSTSRRMRTRRCAVFCAAASDPGPVGPLTMTQDPALGHFVSPLRLK
jgi:hypothetical protein